MSIKEIKEKYNLSEDEAKQIWWWWRKNNDNSTKNDCRLIVLFFLFLIPLPLIIINSYFKSLDTSVRIPLGLVISFLGVWCALTFIGKLSIPKMEKEFWKYMETHTIEEIFHKMKGDL